MRLLFIYISSLCVVLPDKVYHKGLFLTIGYKKTGETAPQRGANSNCQKILRFFDSKTGPPHRDGPAFMSKNIDF